MNFYIMKTQLFCVFVLVCCVFVYVVFVCLSVYLDCNNEVGDRRHYLVILSCKANYNKHSYTYNINSILSKRIFPFTFLNLRRWRLSPHIISNEQTYLHKDHSILYNKCVYDIMNNIPSRVNAHTTEVCNHSLICTRIPSKIRIVITLNNIHYICLLNQRSN